MRFYLTLSFSLFWITGFAVINRGQVDSLKTLVAGSLKNQEHPDTLNINRLNKLAANYFESNPDSTLYYGHKSIELSLKINYKAGVANGLVQTAHASFFKGDFVTARRDFDAAIVIYKALDDLKDLSDCYILYGRMNQLLADYKESLFYLNKALNIIQKLKNERDEGDCYKNIGIVYYSKGDLSHALDYYYKALFIAVKLHDKRATAANYNDIGLVLQSMEIYPRAMEYYNKSLKIFQEIKNLNGIGTVYENIGEVFIAQKKYDDAINYLEKSIVIAVQQDDKDGMSSDYTDLGVCYGHQNQYYLALHYLNNSLEITNKYKIAYNEAYTLVGFAEVYNLQKDYKSAYKYAIEGQNIAVKLGNLAVKTRAALELNKTLAGLGRYDDAYKMLQQYISLKDSLNSNESVQKLTSYNLELDFNDKQHQLDRQQKEKDTEYQERLELQLLINSVFLIVILGMITISIVYYRQKRKQQKINTMLEDKNKEVLQQKASIDDQAQKLNDLNTLKDRLISVLAHDLRAPLSTLRGLFSLLEDNTISHDQMLEMIPSVLKKLEYTSDFLDTLLFWINSQMENFENQAKSFYIKDVVAYEVESYQEQADLKGIKLMYNVPDDAVASTDPNSIRIVIRNLITNAIKFSNHNDSISVTCRLQETDTYMVSVKDTGIGMSEDQLSKLFKSKVNSKTGTANESGTGMGMLFCKDLVEKCSGKIWVTSQQGRGTEFMFTIPAGTIKEPRLEVVS